MAAMQSTVLLRIKSRGKLSIVDGCATDYPYRAYCDVHYLLQRPCQSINQSNTVLL